MPTGVNNLLVWENNQDTPLNSSNLSKFLDVKSESKFMHYSDEEASYEIWADEVIDGPWPTLNDIIPFVNKYVYNKSDNTVRLGHKSDDDPPIYSWISQVSPYKKIIKISPFTKIGLYYFNTLGEVEYETFDSLNDAQILSIESLLLQSDFSANTNYFIYLYHHNAYSDNAYYKILSKYDSENNTNNWQLGDVDNSSPTGRRVIAYRKIGGFKTDSSGYIIEDSVWDISNYSLENVANTYKIMTESGDIRQFKATDVPIDNISFGSSNVEGALTEIKQSITALNNDVYNSDNRFGVELKFSPLKQLGSSFVSLNANEISLKITAGYIDVIGTRVKIDNDIYLASTSIQTKINDGSFGTGRVLGQISNNTLHEELWRCFIDTQGRIIFRSDDQQRATYISQFKGWYDNSGSRCIGKFRVRYSTSFYIEKMSVTATYDEKLPPNSILIFHGTMCPDGLLPADGMWHDINGKDNTLYSIMPEISPESNWQSGSWYEDTPNLWNRTIKMVSEQTLPIDMPKFDSTTSTGSSSDCGSFNDLSEYQHNHEYSHIHTPGTISIISSGGHIHSPGNITFQGTPTDIINVIQSPTGTSVTTQVHEHMITITTSGEHTHSTDKFSGETGVPTNITTNNYSSWPPYKEILFCIKK